MAPLADGVVVGSALVRLIGEREDSGNVAEAALTFVEKIHRAIDAAV